jgi:pimeloyl-ACP methyl ester carboxylesterase
VSEKNILSDGLLIAKKVQKNYGDFYLLGFSIGSLVASYIASKQKVQELFLIGSFDSVALLAKERFGIGPAWLFRYELDNTKHVQHIDANTYLFVSKDDETTFIKNSRNLKNHVKNLVHYAEFDSLSHKELLWDEEVVKTINGVLCK